MGSKHIDFLFGFIAPCVRAQDAFKVDDISDSEFGDSHSLVLSLCLAEVQ